MRGIIAAVSPQGVIGLHGKLPWHYPADLKRFKRLTLGSAIAMGRLTWESIGKPLPKRRNIVITSQSFEGVSGVEFFSDIPSLLGAVDGDLWFIGGARIFQEAMAHCDLIDLTHVPDVIEHAAAVYFPEIDPTQWRPGERIAHEDDPRLKRQVYRRVGG